MIYSEKEILQYFQSYSYVSGGETYVSLSELNNFIELCMKNNVIIFSIEFFKINNSRIIPYEELLGCDSFRLFNEDLHWRDNLINCNEFISKCNKRLNHQQKDLYFTVVLSFPN